MATSTIIYPDKKYRTKLFALLIFWSIVMLAFSIPLGVLIGRDAGGTSGAFLGFLIASFLNLLWVVPVLVIIPLYYRSLRYEIHNDEVIGHVGVVTK
mgnify:CR=1 FL=1